MEVVRTEHSEKFIVVPENQVSDEAELVKLQNEMNETLEAMKVSGNY